MQHQYSPARTTPGLQDPIFSFCSGFNTLPHSRAPWQSQHFSSRHPEGKVTLQCPTGDPELLRCMRAWGCSGCKSQKTHPTPPPPQRGQSAPIQTCCRSFTSGLKEAWGAKPISAALRDAERWARIHSKIPRGGLGVYSPAPAPLPASPFLTPCRQGSCDGSEFGARRVSAAAPSTGPQMWLQWLISSGFHFSSLRGGGGGYLSLFLDTRSETEA